MKSLALGAAVPNAFIYETENNRLQRLISLAVLVAILTTGVIIAVENARATRTADESFLLHYTPNIIHDITPVKQFIISALSGMIIFPIPNEVAFYAGLRQGNPVILSVLAAVAGFALGNIVSYILGRRFSKRVMYLLSAKQVYKLRRAVNTYGIGAVFVVNLLPAPSDILTFGLGIIRYNVKRLFLVLILANLIKFSILAYAISFMS